MNRISLGIKRFYAVQIMCNVYSVLAHVGGLLVTSNFFATRGCWQCCEHGICANIAPGRLLKTSYSCPGKLWTLTFSNPGKSWRAMLKYLY